MCRKSYALHLIEDEFSVICVWFQVSNCWDSKRNIHSDILDKPASCLSCKFAMNHVAAYDFCRGSPIRMSLVILFCHARSCLHEQHLIDRRMSKQRRKVLSHCSDDSVLNSSRKVIGERNHIRFVIWAKWPFWFITVSHISSTKSHYFNGKAMKAMETSFTSCSGYFLLSKYEIQDLNLNII